MNTALAVNPQAQNFDDALSLTTQAKGLKVIDNNTLKAADEMLATVKDTRKQVSAYFKPLCDQAHKMHKDLLAKMKEVDTPLAEAEMYLKGQAVAYIAEQERKQKEEEERLRKLQEEEQLKAAIQAEEHGAPEVAEAILEESTVMPAPMAAPAPKLANGTLREEWKWEITDPNLIPREYLKLDEVKINGVVRAMKKATNIPGIRVYSTKNIAAGRR
ncbi:MAG: hypothetical protein C4542_07290 [Dehalococcoidia bacterium]|nr:MAG: hypothetical protein C4542_07290 [Dehalococcoidia bacterium]